MFLKKSIAAIGAAALLVATTAMPALAKDKDKELPVPEADANGVYCQAGIIWQIRDQWDHKTEIYNEPKDEKETITLDGTYKNVNITGNGEYTVEMSGYHVDDEWIEAGITVGYLGVELNLDFDTYSNVDEHKGVLFEIKKATVDGVEYTFTNEANEDGEYQQVLEDIENAMNGEKVVKIKNGWGNLPENSTPAITNDAWTTTDPITITFEVTGLPTDKVEGYAEEYFEQVYGNGTIDAAGGDDSEVDSAADESTADESVAESKADSSKADAASSSSSDSSSKSDSKDSSNVGLIAGIAGGAVLLIIIIAVVVKKKS